MRGDAGEGLRTTELNAPNTLTPRKYLEALLERL